MTPARYRQRPEAIRAVPGSRTAGTGDASEARASQRGGCVGLMPDDAVTVTLWPVTSRARVVERSW